MADRQPYLNGNFYGPAMPKQHRGRRIMCTILKVAIGFIVVVGIVSLILGLILIPRKLEFNVTSAKLTQFNVIGNQLFYKMALNFTIHNPNKRYRVYYDTNQMAILYKNQRIDTHWLPRFFQATKSTVVVGRNVFEGQQLLLLTGDEIVKYNNEKEGVLFPIDVKFFFRLRMKSGNFVLKLRPKVYCGLHVPLIDRPESVFFFPNTACDFSF